ncbi:ribosomal protection-like ABC-F family protein [Halobacillus sp. BAB-2008]|uniref:ribosomal protection-like ABC-F family protein n=1 Tax=Halobacillus sp. BAB-2008 TaxID=1246484 RepID=UPI000586C778|nr:ABC-F type ribosomal protection protein [Halobacillus sp. BAB-2008]
MNEHVRIRDVDAATNEKVILKGAAATCHKGDVIGIIGPNGCGKSTLLRLISGCLNPGRGRIEILGRSVRLLEQEVETFPTEPKLPEEKRLRNKWQVPDGTFTSLSGGEKLKARLARAFAQGSDLLLLDEPTNHLDEAGMEALLQEVKRYKGTILLVSHDRRFLDEAVSKIWSIENKGIVENVGNYSAYMEVREQRKRTEQRAVAKQQKMVEQIEGQMKELASWSKKAHDASTKKEGYKEYYRKKAKRTDKQVKSKQKRLEKELDKHTIDRLEEEKDIRFSLKTKDKTGRRFVEAKGLTKRFGDRILFEDVHFTIQHGEKIGLAGPNGSGKTTLLNIILGRETAEGDVWISPAANVGVLTQQVFDLPLDETPARYFYQESFEARGKVRTLMDQLGFTDDQWKEKFKDMSMGERVKCKLMVHLLDGKDVLILDEPTNHLDLPSREQLEKTLALYEGTLIVVSHDRYFMEKTTDTTWSLAGRKIRKGTRVKPVEESEAMRMRLETERQEVLGKLSFLLPGDDAYQELDAKFKELTRLIHQQENKGKGGEPFPFS